MHLWQQLVQHPEAFMYSATTLPAGFSAFKNIHVFCNSSDNRLLGLDLPAQGSDFPNCRDISTQISRFFWKSGILQIKKLLKNCILIAIEIALLRLGLE